MADTWDRPGTLVAEHWVEEGGYEVFENNGAFDLYEIPQYGGYPMLHSIPFATLDAAVAHAQTWT